MQIAQNVNKNRVVGERLEEKSFSLQSGPQLMRILSSSLYTEKEWAVVRELSANARDAWVSAGRPEGVAFTINTVGDAFTIRDFGTGLSHEDVMRLLTTYGASTKSDENSSIGGFGIGSKSPFAYNNEFTVISYHNGTANMYHAILGPDSVPVITHLSSAPTTDCNGLMFRVPYKHPSDSRTFKQHAWNDLKYIGAPFSVDNVKVELPSDEFISFDGFSYSYDYERHRYGNCYLYVGGIPYKTPDTLKSEINLFGNFFFDIGMVDVAVTREGLELTKKTKGALMDAASAVMNYWTGKIDKELNSTSSYISRNRLWANYPATLNTTNAHVWKSLLIPPQENLALEKLIAAHRYGEKIVIEDAPVTLALLKHNFNPRRANNMTRLKPDEVPECEYKENPDCFVFASRLTPIPKRQRSAPAVKRDKNRVRLLKHVKGGKAHGIFLTKEEADTLTLIPVPHEPNWTLMSRVPYHGIERLFDRVPEKTLYFVNKERLWNRENAEAKLKSLTQDNLELSCLQAIVRCMWGDEVRSRFYSYANELRMRKRLIADKEDEIKKFRAMAKNFNLLTDDLDSKLKEALDDYTNQQLKLLPEYPKELKP